MALLIKNGTIIGPLDEMSGDVRCREGLISEIGEGLQPDGEDVIDAADCFVLPGGVDPHVHMQLPVAGTVSSDDFESGTSAALAGGTTTIIDFVHPERGQRFSEALADRLHEARAAVCDFGLHMAITWWGEETFDWMGECLASGIPTFKTYMAYKETVGLEDDELVQAMQAAADLDGLILMHAEHGDAIEHLRERSARAGRLGPSEHAHTRPSPLEGEATHRAATLAGVLGSRLYVVHVTCRESVDAIASAQKRGWRVFGETCPQYLLLDDSVYDKPDFESAAFVIAPPIRPTGHQQALWSAVEEGVLETIGTDHCPFTMAQKRLGEGDFRLIPGGAAGVEHRLALLWTHGVESGRISRRKFVDLVSTRPAELFGLGTRKGVIQKGADADLVIWDPTVKRTISASTDHHRCDRSIFEGFEVTGAPRVVVSAGKVRFREGTLDADVGCGRFLRRSLPAS